MTPLQQQIAVAISKCRAYKLQPAAIMLAHSDNEGLCEELGPQWGIDRTTGQARWIEVEEIKRLGLVQLYGLPVIKGPHTGVLITLVDPVIPAYF